MKKIPKILLGVLLLPFCFGMTWQLGSTVFSIPYKGDLPYFFMAGGIAYLTIHILFKKPILTYVFAHELTHAFFAVLFGGSIKAFHATERGGQVTVTKSNFLITLAPYFFPLYTFLVLILSLLVQPSQTGPVRTIVFMAGATFAFHILLTLIFLKADQKDIREEGAFFSYPLIYLFNVVFAALLMHLLLAQKNGFLDFLGNGIIRGVHLYSLMLTRLYTFLA